MMLAVSGMAATLCEIHGLEGYLGFTVAPSLLHPCSHGGREATAWILREPIRLPSWKYQIGKSLQVAGHVHYNCCSILDQLLCASYEM